jgi:hypothetical protein
LGLQVSGVVETEVWTADKQPVALRQKACCLCFDFAGDRTAFNGLLFIWDMGRVKK